MKSKNNKDAVAALVIIIVGKCLDVNPATMPKDAHFVKDLNADSLKLMELQMRFEEKFNFDFTRQEWDSFHRVDDLLDNIWIRIQDGRATFPDVTNDLKSPA